MRNLLRIALLCTIPLMLTGCSVIAWFNRQPVAVPSTRVAVLDFSLAPRVVEQRDCKTRDLHYAEKPVETEKDVRGWWFGSQDVYYNGNMGLIAADLFSDALCAKGWIVYPRPDLRKYYADKKEILGSKLKLGGADLERALWKLNPVEIGREIGADKVVVGHISDSELRHNRALGGFGTSVGFRVSVYDVKTGALELTKEFSGFHRSSTPYAVYEDSADTFAAMMTKQYCSQPAR